MSRKLATILLHAFCITIYAQSFSYNIETTGAISKGTYTPFWHISNRQGLGSVATKNGYLRAGISGSHTLGKKNWSVDYAADIIIAKNLTSTVFIQQAFADINWRMLTLSLGQKERWSNFKNHRLSTGGLTESGNARPIPQIRLEVPQYWDIFGTKGWFTMRGHLAYGWFSDEEWQKGFVAKGKSRTVGVRYHSKAAYFKLGNEKLFPLTYEFGLEMAAQFGGTTYNMLNVPGRTNHNPVRLKDYLSVLVPVKGDSRYNVHDQSNISGNQLGSWHTAITWHAKEWQLGAYYEHTFEDHSQMFWEYGLWSEQLVGLQLKLNNGRWIKGINIEYFNLKNQSGPIYHDSNSTIPDQISCVDNNYWHHTYNGWFNYGMIIGTPLVTSPIYNSNGVLTTFNNRVEAFHLGIEGEPIEELGYRILLTKSNNWGTYGKPFTEIKENLSGLFELTYNPKKFNGWSISASFAFDNGELYNNNSGGMFTIRKSGIINLFREQK